MSSAKRNLWQTSKRKILETGIRAETTEPKPIEVLDCVKVPHLFLSPPCSASYRLFAHKHAKNTQWHPKYARLRCISVWERRHSTCTAKKQKTTWRGSARPSGSPPAGA